MKDPDSPQAKAYNDLRLSSSTEHFSCIHRLRSTAMETIWASQQDKTEAILSQYISNL